MGEGVAVTVQVCVVVNAAVAATVYSSVGSSVVARVGVGVRRVGSAVANGAEFALASAREGGTALTDIVGAGVAQPYAVNANIAKTKIVNFCISMRIQSAAERYTEKLPRIL